MKSGDDCIGIIMLWEFIIWLATAVLCIFLADRWKERWMHTDAVDHLLYMEQELIQERDLYCETLHRMADSYYKISMVHVDTGNCRHIKISDWELRRMQVSEAVARHSHIRIAGMELERKELNIDHLVKTCKKYLNAILRDKPLSFMWIGSLEGQYIGDEVRLKLCFFHLLDNAVQQSRLDGGVRIELRKGVSPLNEAADEFMIEIRRDSFETETAMGTGFFVAKTILDAMKGEIHVKSRNGQGTTVTVYFSLPRA